ncbi:MAG: transcriptional repressor NrdR [Nitriliruptorales bacterium]|nr:transcriptional repressor NrdR [Nitriliruptorales bacterium]
MRCPYCDQDEDRVVDSRPSEGGAAVRRRRQCLACAHRFSTYERVEQEALAVRKRGGEIEPFHRSKLLTGMGKATANLAVSADDLRRAAARIESRLRALGRREVSSERVGAEVLHALRELDPVAYVRFASVYKGFTSPEDFRRELATLEKEAPPKRQPSSPTAP